MVLKKSYGFVQRNIPQQSRGRKTIETILTATASLLDEVGFEQLSTNQICKRANLTPPALYHYFHNKYDVVRALGDTLFQDITNALHEWDKNTPPGATADDLKSLLGKIAQIIHQFPAGPQLLRSLHASPKLAQTRLEAIDELANILTDRMMYYVEDADREETNLRLKLAVNIGFATLDFVFEDETVDAQRAFQYAAETLTSHMNLADLPHSRAELAE